MGSHLSTPCKVIEEESGAGNGMQFVAAGMQVTNMLLSWLAEDF
jgi:hypothetical protein